jgi:ceramide glucosyltransferase
VLREILGILTGVSLALTVWRWALHRRFPLHLPECGAAGDACPGITFLKPLKGADEATKDCLRSWLAQSYPGPAQFLFGVASGDDPVCAAVRDLLAEFPHVDAQLILCPQNLGANRKVSTLRQLESLSKYPLLMISDADARVSPHFAASIASLCRKDVGLVNCFYRLANPATLAMRWEAIAVNADFWTHVLQAATVKRIDFALGAVMTVPASELAAIGGFAALSDYLADDYQLGQRIAARGRKIMLAPAVVDCWEPPMGWGAVWRHQLRWARTIRVCQPGPFFVSIINNAGVWPLMLLAVSLRGPAWAVALGLVALATRIGTAQQQLARMTQDRSYGRFWWLVPVKDVLDVVIWAAAFWGNHVEWRGERYRIIAGGQLVRV